MKKTKSDAVLSDVIESKNIIYRITSKESKNYNLSMRFDEVEKAIVKKLQTFKIGDEIYEQFSEVIMKETKRKDTEIATERSVFSYI
ncbi:MAG: hypothetical protein ACOYN2_06010 [Patescibacteria group bacterium]